MSGTLLTARERDAIRAGLLGRIAAIFQQHEVEYSLENPDVGYLEANALATILSGAEKRAEGALDAILPDKAIGDSQRHHGRILDLAQSAGETPHDFAERILATRRLRLGAGTPAEWVAWAKQVTGVSDAYWYSRLAPGTVTSTPGTGILIVLGPPQGQGVTDTRIVSGAILTRVKNFILGTVDQDGNAIAGAELKPVSMPVSAGLVGASNVDINTTYPLPTDVTLSIRNIPAFEFPWAPYAGLAVDSSTTNSVVVVGDYHMLAGLPMLLNIGTANVRGGYVKVVATTAVFGGVKTVISFAAQAAAPIGTVYPAPPNWTQLRDAVFGVFDALGPGDFSSRRYPLVDVSGDPVLRLNNLGKAAMNVKGVLSALVAPGDTTPSGTQIVELGTLTIYRT